MLSWCPSGENCKHRAVVLVAVPALAEYRRLPQLLRPPPRGRKMFVAFEALLPASASGTPLAAPIARGHGCSHPFLKWR
jgi:hypothetical protein